VAARAPVIALACPFRARRTGAGHHAQLEAVACDQGFELCSRALGQFSFP